MTARVPERHCTGTNNRGEPCGRSPIKGGTVCYTHGGAAKQVKAAASERLAVAAAEKVLAGMLHNPNAVPVTDPVGELQRLTGVLRDAFAEAGSRMNALTGVGSLDAKGTEQLRAQVVLWERLLGHFRAALVDMARLGIEERFVALEERRGDALAAELRGLLIGLGLGADVRANVLVGEMLGRLADGTPLPKELTA